MAKVIDLRWVKETDPRYQEGWTVSVTLGLNERARQTAGRSEGDAVGSKVPPPRRRRKAAKLPRGK